MSEWLRTSLSRHIALNALKVALVVGTLLNLVNQGEQLLLGENVSIFHLLLNYLVPYSVASYSAAKNQIEKRKMDDEQAE